MNKTGGGATNSCSQFQHIDVLWAVYFPTLNTYSMVY